MESQSLKLKQHQKDFVHGGKYIRVQWEVRIKPFHWRMRMRVDGKWSPWCNEYTNILEYRGFAVRTAWWKPRTKSLVPFRLSYARAI